MQEVCSFDYYSTCFIEISLAPDTLQASRLDLRQRQSRASLSVPNRTRPVIDRGTSTKVRCCLPTGELESPTAFIDCIDCIACKVSIQTAIHNPQSTIHNPRTHTGFLIKLTVLAVVVDTRLAFIGQPTISSTSASL
jgi:hypothetical protein